MTAGFSLPWEESGWEYPSSFAPPLQVAIEASDGASDYGNKFGEPVLAGMMWCVLAVVCLVFFLIVFFFTSISSFFALPTQGFARSFGMRLANGERREWIKPIMFSGGLGSIENEHVKKEEAASGRKCWRLMDYDGKINVLRFLSFNLTLDLFTHQKNKCVCVRF